MLLDATILIDLSLARAKAREFIDAGPASAFRTHPVAAAELMAGARNSTHLHALDDLLSRFHSAAVRSSDFEHCMAFLRRHTLTHGVGWPDCLIAATALRLGLPIATLNDKHFRVFRGLKVVRPY